MDADKTCLFMFVQDARADSAGKIVTSPNLKKHVGFIVFHVKVGHLFL